MDHAAEDGRDDAPLILIVDDERDIADMLDSYFRLEGYRTIVAHDAAGPSLPRTARSEVRMSLAWENGGLELAVADDGPGFADAALERATEPFWGDSKGGGGHLGPGLYVSRLLAEKHGGGLEVANGPGGGAIARATLAAPLA